MCQAQRILAALGVVLVAAIIGVALPEAPAGPLTTANAATDSRDASSPAAADSASSQRRAAAVERRERSAVPTATPQTASARIHTPGQRPGHGPSWIVEAYRLTESRSSIVERRRGYFSPAGELELTDLTPGTWQLALVAPRFVWGPTITALPGERLEAALPVDGAQRTISDWIDTNLGPRGAEVRVELFAVWSREPNVTCRLQRRVASCTTQVGEAFTFAGLTPGRYEVAVSRTDGAAEPVRSDLDVGAFRTTPVAARRKQPAPGDAL